MTSTDHSNDGGSNIVYSQLGPGIEEEIIQSMLDHFFPRGPVSQGLHMVGEDNIEWLKLGMPQWLTSGVGVVARDAGSGQLAGCVVSKILTKEDATTFDMEDSVTNEKAKNLLYIASELEAALNCFEHYSADRGLEVAMLSVAATYGGRGLGTRLVEESERLALSKGCQFSTAQATGLASQRILEKHGYETFYEMVYEGYTFKGQTLDTARMGPHKSAKVMAKRLANK